MVELQCAGNFHLFPNQAEFPLDFILSQQLVMASTAADAAAAPVLYEDLAAIEAEFEDVELEIRTWTR